MRGWVRFGGSGWGHVTSSSSVCLVVIIDGGCSRGAMLSVRSRLVGVKQNLPIKSFVVLFGNKR